MRTLQSLRGGVLHILCCGSGNPNVVCHTKFVRAFPRPGKQQENYLLFLYTYSPLLFTRIFSSRGFLYFVVFVVSSYLSLILASWDFLMGNICYTTRLCSHLPICPHSQHKYLTDPSIIYSWFRFLPISPFNPLDHSPFIQLSTCIITTASPFIYSYV